MTTTQQQKPRPFLEVFGVVAPSPGVLLSDPLVAQVLRFRAGTVTGLGTGLHAWRQHYATVYARLQVPWDWVTIWTVKAEVDEVVALRRLQRLLSLLSQDPAAQTLTVAEAISALTEGLLENHRTAALLSPGIRAHFIAKAH